MSNQRSRESFLIHVMNNGFLRAANSFSKFVGKNTRVTHSQPTALRRAEFSASDAKGNQYVLTTQIIGELSGKSYLIFNEEECHNLTMLVGHTSSTPTTDQMKEALLIEVDNIISASVIAELSEALQIEIYGDVPGLKKLPAASLSDFIIKDGSQDMNTAFIIDTVFQFNVDKTILPRFAWKVSDKVLDIIPSERLAVK
jgi:chemotaxis protein CheY-P-specific phosphatase CheC